MDLWDEEGGGGGAGCRIDFKAALRAAVMPGLSRQAHVSNMRKMYLVSGALSRTKFPNRFPTAQGRHEPHSMVTPQIGGFILGGMAGLSLTEVAAIEAFLAGSKTLDGETPHWDKSNFPGELAGRWPILDELGIGRAHLRFRVSESDPSAPSISLIFGGGSIGRVDLVPSGNCEPNPPDGYRMGLPPRVCGSHFHSWHDNKDYLTENGLGSMPYRRALQPQIRRLEQLVPWFCEQVNISITADQRRFNVPLQRTLFPSLQ